MSYDEKWNKYLENIVKEIKKNPDFLNTFMNDLNAELQSMKREKEYQEEIGQFRKGILTEAEKNPQYLEVIKNYLIQESQKLDDLITESKNIEQANKCLNNPKK